MVRLYKNFDISKNHKRSIILIGNFDGVHLGHQKLFKLAKSYKKKYNLKLPIIVDGGVRKGSDIVKYLCLGADFVGIGRPAMFGLIIDGQKGVQKIFWCSSRVCEWEYFYLLR